MFYTLSYCQNFWQQAHYPDTCQIYDLIGLKNGTILFGTDKGIYSSIDLGQTWIPTGYNDATGEFKINNSGTLFINTITYSSRIKYSFDNGLNWTNTNTSFMSMSSFYPYSNDTLIAGDSDGSNYYIHKSTDRGNTWYNVQNMTPNSFIYDFAGTSNGYIYGAYTNWTANTDGVYYSKDAGETWQLKTLCGNPFLGIAVNSQDEIFVVGYCGVYKSSDYGNTWVHIKSGWSATGIVIDKEDNIYVSCDWEIGGPGVHRSTDNGQTWETFNSGLPSTYVSKIMIDSNDYLYCFVGYGLYRSTNPVNVGISAINTFNSVCIYPNPAKDIVYIKQNNRSSELCTVKIFDMLGNLIQTTKTINEQMCINISSFNKGLYLIEISTESANKISKLIIQ